MEKVPFKGLTNREAKLKLLQHGKNVIHSEKTASLQQIFFSQFPTVINGILAIAAVFSFFIGNILDGIFIAAIILINGLLGFIQEYRAARSMERLKDYTAPTARVIREEKEEEILAENLVPDDVVILDEGSRVPADGALIVSHHLEVDESILTGESLVVIKQMHDTVFLGTLVTKGRGYFKAGKTGMQTRFGQITSTVSTIKSEKTPLQKNLDDLGKTLSFAVVVAGLLVVPIGLTYGGSLVPLILVGASIGVAAIPEGLPAVVTIAFALGAHRMAKQGAIVRKMASIETLGAVQVILSDKTGTITQNLMRVKSYWLEHQEKLPLLLKACVLGNTASLVEKGDGKTFEIVGDQTDGALLLWAREQAGKSPVPDNGKVQDEYVFDPEYKTITTVWKQGGATYVFVRGAPEAILSKSTLPVKQKEEVIKRFEQFAKEGLRIIAFAVKTERHTGKLAREHLERGLTFLGFVGIYDPPREDVMEAIKKSRLAGIHVIMVTGDNEFTALSLAKDIGLIDTHEDVVTGGELTKMSDNELENIILKTRIFARTQPDEKQRLVSILQKKGLVVGVTGDGVNDALALKKSDVGIAMGQGGTDVAKEASDIILTDNNFATLIKATEEGRVIYKNITNAVIYLIAGNLAEISLVLLAALFKLPFVLLPTQILWMNLVTDSLPAIALATGSRDTSVMRKKPRSSNEPILNAGRLMIICFIGFSLSGLLLVLFALLLKTNTEAQARGVIFNLMIYFQLLVVMAIGRHSLKRGNIFLVFTVVLIFLLQVTISSLPFFQEIFHLEP
jgi:Ca2+-transporting ATPase